MVVFDAYLQFAFAQAGAEALAWAGLAGTANGLPAIVQQDAVTAPQGGQGADHMQGLHLAVQLQAAAP